MVFLVLTLLVAAVEAHHIAHFPPPNSVDDYIRVNISDGSSNITELTVAVWAKRTPSSYSNDGDLFSYMSSTSDNDNLLIFGGNTRACVKLYINATSMGSL